MKNETKTRSTAGRRVLLSRLAVGLLSLFLGLLLILWDMGVVELPFLVRRSRRESPTLTEEQKSEAASEEVLYFDRDGYAAQCLANLYPYPMLEDGRDKLTAAPFDRETASLVRTRISAKDYECIMGFLLSSDGVIYRGSDLARIPNSQNFRLTCWRDSNGKAVFQNRESRIYHVLNSDTLEFEPILFHSGERPFDVPMPADYLAGEEGRERFFENELFGYRVTYQEGLRDKTVTVEAQYPTAFPYSEGIAVMADGDGRVTLRNEKGEVIPMEKSLILPEKKGYEALGFHGFDHSLLRVAVAEYAEDGTLLSQKETVIDAEGKEFPIPEGYRVLSYYDGVFVLTDGFLCGYYSHRGEWLTSPVYAAAEPLIEGLGTVMDENGSFGLVDREGDVVLPCAFQGISSFSEGIAILETFDGRCYLISKVKGIYRPDGVEDPIPPSSSFYTKVTITRGPHNSFVPEENITLILPEISVTSTRKPLPEFWE